MSMPIICGGLILCCGREANFHLTGAMLAIGATLLRALKSVMQEKLLVDPAERLDSVTLLYYMSPHAALLLFIASLIFEGVAPIRLLLPFHLPFIGLPLDTAQVTGVPVLVSILLASCIAACILNLTGNEVTKLTSAVMLQVLGNLKACLLILVSVAIFKNKLEPLQAVGMSICLFGMWIYQSKGAVVSEDVKPAVGAKSMP